MYNFPSTFLDYAKKKKSSAFLVPKNAKKMLQS